MEKRKSAKLIATIIMAPTSLSLGRTRRIEASVFELADRVISGTLLSRVISRVQAKIG